LGGEENYKEFKTIKEFDTISSELGECRDKRFLLSNSCTINVMIMERIVS